MYYARIWTPKRPLLPRDRAAGHVLERQDASPALFGNEPRNCGWFQAARLRLVDRVVPTWNPRQCSHAANGLLMRTPRISCPSFRSSVYSTAAPARAAATTTNASQKESLARSANSTAARIAA